MSTPPRRPAGRKRPGGGEAVDDTGSDGKGTPVYRPRSEPYYRAHATEVQLFELAWRERLPVMLKGPTGCGKTRFVEYMAWRLSRPLVTVACHEDLTASDLVGRYLLRDDETVWIDGPLTTAVREGAICYLDEVVEARKDTVVVIHPLTDDRRILPIEKKGALVHAPPEFMLVISYNPGYQSVVKDLKQSTRQRFATLEFEYPAETMEAEIVAHEGGVDAPTSRKLVRIGHKIRNLRNHGLDEGVSTRLLIYAAKLMSRGLPARDACLSALVLPLTDDPELHRSMNEVVHDFFG
ncbi:CbbQ/NirQ/NorQ/GpvN family protein [Myxococcota bacterium]|nr:CbbQ/NirQ/NorQ/GpvN family protein [Myxococcota bacterium]